MIRPLFQGLKDSFVNGVRETMRQMINIRLGLLLAFLFIMILATLFIWFPFLTYMHQIDLKSRKLIAILPLDLIMNMAHMHKYIEINAHQVY